MMKEFNFDEVQPLQPIELDFISEKRNNSFADAFSESE